MKNIYQETLITTLKEKIHVIAEKAVALQYKVHPGVWEKYGLEGKQKSIRDMIYHLEFLIESIATEDTAIFQEYIIWLRELFQSINIPEGEIELSLNSIHQMAKEYVTEEELSILNTYIKPAKEVLKRSIYKTASHIDEKNSLTPLTKQYIDALLNNDRHRASFLILEAANKDISIRDIYLYVFQVSQYEIGRLWMTNKISVAQEHYCTAATQLIMSQLYSHIFSNEKNGYTLIAFCIDNELHEIGIRMVADFFEIEGWDTYYYGANTPFHSAISTIQDINPDLVAISATLASNASKVSTLIETIRSINTKENLKIMVGGRLFNISRDLWKKFKADGYASDAESAVQMGNILVGVHT